jgi:hypothetical protein
MTRTCISLLALFALVLPSTAAAKPGKPPRGTFVFDYGASGGFKVKRKRVRRVHLVPATNTSTYTPACGTKKLRVKGRQKLSVASRAGYDTWIVGRNAPKSADGVAPIKVKVVKGGRTVKGKLELTFTSAGTGSGKLKVGRHCTITLNFRRKPTAAAAGDAQATAAKRRRRHRRRPGCHRYCRQAGGFGAPPDEKPGPVRIRTQRIRVDRDGIIGVRATCARDKRCVGAILVDGYNTSYGRADLNIRAHKTRTVHVYVPRKGRRYLRKHGRDKQVYATVPLKDNVPVSISKRLTLLPHR